MSVALRAVLAQSMVVGIPGADPRPEDLELFGREGLGGVILFARNVQSPRQVWELNQALARAARRADRPPLFIMVDQEGGSVARLKAPFTDGPDLAALGGAAPETLAAHGARLGAELKAAGFNWNLAPVLDVHAVAGGIMARRSLGGATARVADWGGLHAGLQGQGGAGPAPSISGPGAHHPRYPPGTAVVELARAELERWSSMPFRGGGRGPGGGDHGLPSTYAAWTRASGLPFAGGAQGALAGRIGLRGARPERRPGDGGHHRRPGPGRGGGGGLPGRLRLLLVCHRPELALAALDRWWRWPGRAPCRPPASRPAGVA